jgi:hypothetical protein
VTQEQDLGSLAQDLHLDDEQCVRRNHSRDAGLPVREMWSYANPADATDPHAFHTIKETSKHLPAVDSQRGEQCGSVVFETTLVERAPILPSNWFPAAEPDSKANVIDSMSLNDLAQSGSLLKQFDARTHREPPNE